MRADVMKCNVFITPGVPKEMKLMFERDVLPRVKEIGGGDAVILSRTLHTFGLGESAIAEMLGDLMNRDRNPSVGTTVSNGIVSLRINSRSNSRDEAVRQLEETDSACRSCAGRSDFRKGRPHAATSSRPTSRSHRGKK